MFVDDFSRFSWLYLLKHKSDVLSIFKSIKATVENQFSTQIKCLRTDCEGEYTSNDFTAFCSSTGITHQLSCPHTPQQNGIVERKHRHIVECALTLLSHASLPITHWTYAVTTTLHLINRLPTPRLSHKSLWEKLFHKPPDISHIRNFGYICFPYLRPYNTHKLQPRTTPCIFLGYPTHTKGYICLNPKTRRVYISKHVLFNETEFLPDMSLDSTPQTELVTSTFDFLPWLLVMMHICSLTLNSSSTALETLSPSLIFPPFFVKSLSPILSTDVVSKSAPIESHPSTESSTPESLLPSASSPQPPMANTHPMHTCSKHVIFKSKSFHTTTIDYTQIEPPTHQIASKYPHWCTAMDEEYTAFQRQQTWSLVPHPPGKNIVGCKWVFKLKRNSDGSISCYKERLVAKAFTNNMGLNFKKPSVLL